MSIIGNAILLGGGETLPEAGGVSFGGTYAFIRVTYPSGSTCTCTKGNTILTAEDTSGSYTFAVEIPSSGTDTWTVSCMDGTDSTSDTIGVSTAGINYVVLSYAPLTIVFYHRNITFNAISGWTWDDFITDLRGNNIMNPENNHVFMYDRSSSNCPTFAGFPICYDSACREYVYLTDPILPNATYYDDE